MPDQDKFPEVCGWFGVRRVVMRGAMKQIKKLESEGVPVTSQKFSEIMKKEWEDVKKQQREICPGS